MGTSSERRLIVKHTFLEFEEKADTDGRRRSFTDGAILTMNHDDAWNMSNGDDANVTDVWLDSCPIAPGEVSQQELANAVSVESEPESVGSPSAKENSRPLSTEDCCASPTLEQDLSIQLAKETAKLQLAEANERLCRENAQLRAMVERPDSMNSGMVTMPISAQQYVPWAMGPYVYVQLPHENRAENVTATLCLSESISSDGYTKDPSTEHFTTVMLRNLPNQYTRDMLVDMLHAEGFAGKFNFVYLPIDFKTHLGLGYAFVDLISPAEADRARRHFEGFSGWMMRSDKVCSVSWSHPDQQGFAAHVSRYRNSPIMHESVQDSWKPALFSGGQRMPFPRPTRKLRIPRIRVL